jgi:hypothetical protein
MIVIGYQTLEDKDNIDYVEEFGPFECKRNNAWLGFGYYFWDTNIDWAKRWGENSYERIGLNFIIGSCKIDISTNCFDLHGNVSHQLDLIECYTILKEQGVKESKLRISSLIDFLKKNAIFDYDSIRAADFPNNIEKIFFAKKEFTYINQRVQICVINKKNVISSPFKVVYPEKYVN